MGLNPALNTTICLYFPSLKVFPFHRWESKAQSGSNGRSLDFSLEEQGGKLETMGGKGLRVQYSIWETRNEQGLKLD